MRALFVSLIDDYWGGSEVLWSLAAESLTLGGHEVAAYFGYYKCIPQIKRLSAKNIYLYFGTPKPKRWWNRLLYPPKRGLRAFKHALREFKPDLVIISQCGVRDGMREARVCRAFNIKYTIVNQLVEPLFYDSITWKAAREQFLNAAKTWFVSVENKERLESWLGDHLINSIVISNATGRISKTRLNWPDDRSGFKLACVGRLFSGQKGQDLLIDAIAGPKWADRKISITLFGEGEREILDARMKFKGCGKIKFGGHVAEISNIWRDHHALVLPSRYEGQSLAMLEAMLHGRPVFVTPVGGTNGLVLDNINGLVAKSIDLEGICDLLERAWQSRENWQEYGKVAAASALKWVDPDPGLAMAKRIEAVV